MDMKATYLAAYEKFGGVIKPSQEEVTDYCRSINIEPFDAGEYADFVYQKHSDERMARLLAEIITALSGIRFVGLYMNDDELKAAREANSDVVEKIARLIEDHDVPMRLVANVRREIGAFIEGIINMAVTTIDVKTSEAMEHICKKELASEDVTTGQLAKYIVRVFEDAEKAKKEKVEKEQ